MTDYLTIDEACEALVHQDMDPIHKEKWVEALRSGSYTQITGGLKNCPKNAHIDEDITDSYCCLGVAADVLVDHKLWRDGTLYVFSSKDDFERNSGDLLEALKHEGYDECDASGAVSYSDTDIPSSLGIHSHMAALLAYLNNNKRLTFEQIGEFVESKYFPLLNCYREDLPLVVKDDMYMPTTSVTPTTSDVAHWVMGKMGWEDIEYQEEDERPDN